MKIEGKHKEILIELLLWYLKKQEWDYSYTSVLNRTVDGLNTIEYFIHNNDYIEIINL